jgi:hypothetical protein
LFLSQIGVEDFSKYGKAAYAYLSSVFDSSSAEASHLFLPRVPEAADASVDTLGRTRKVSEINEAADANRIASILRSSPRNLIIIRFMTAGSGRLDALMEKGMNISFARGLCILAFFFFTVNGRYLPSCCLLLHHFPLLAFAGRGQMHHAVAALTCPGQTVSSSMDVLTKSRLTPDENGKVKQNKIK